MIRTSGLAGALLGLGLACAGDVSTPAPAPAPAPVSAPDPVPERGAKKTPAEGARCGAKARPTCVGDSVATCADGAWHLTPCDPYGCIPVGTPGFEGLTEDSCGAD